MRHFDATVAPSRAGLMTLLWACLITAALRSVPVVSGALYPLRLFVTFIHEGGHASAALLTGGRVAGIVIAPDASGYTLTQGGWAPLVVMAGYMGATLYGAGLLALGRRPAFARAALLLSAGWIGLLSLVFVRPWGDLFSFCWGMAIAIFLGLSARRLSAHGAELLAMFLGVQCVVNAVSDLWTLVGLSARPGGPTTDAVAMSLVFPLPPLVWALLWSGSALAVLTVTLRPYWRAAVTAGGAGWARKNR